MDTVTVVLLVLLLVALAILILVVGRARRAAPGNVDEGTLRRLLAEAIRDTAPESSSENAPTGAVSPDDTRSERARHRLAAAPSGAPDEAEPVAAITVAAAPFVAGPGGTAPIPAEIRDEALADAERIRREAREENAAERAEIAAERARIADRAHALAEDQQELAADRERFRADRSDLVRQRSDIAEREQALRDRAAAADARQIALDQARTELGLAQSELDQGRAELVRSLEEYRRERDEALARIASLTIEDARAELLASQEEAVRRDAAALIRRVETEAQQTAKQRARAIVAEAIQRVASDQTSQSVVSVLQLPSDDLKGRIIGREGRNIRAFETVTGVNVIIDDTPEAVLLSCFDPVRREIGRVTLQALIDDGRIHPHRIEEAFERAQEEVEALCQRAAEDALVEVGIADLHPELVALIGRLKYRTSYGQNVLGHLVETSHIARIMAAEMGMDPAIVARGAFLHDIGKALTHEAQGSHAIVGADIARRFGESAEVVHCIEAHHDEVAPTTVEAVLTQAADACSGGRPGARRESLESYVQRLEHIEAIAAAKKGVDKVFAMQAGRELRVMVKPDVVDDLDAHVMAREVAKQIEEELTYPGQVRVTVIRESRATEVAR